MDYAELVTEKVNPDTVDIDTGSTEEILRMMHEEDCKVAAAVGEVLPQIAAAVDMIAERLANGGRLIYVGAGTSGRLGVLDASECPPTFGTAPEQVVGVIAGGDQALRTSIEGAEDCRDLGAADVDRLQVCRRDVLVGISASGNAPYVLGAVERAARLGAATVALCNTQAGTVLQAADVAVVPVVGPEVIMGSTRLKAGTAQKMVLNMLSTASMIKLGKVYRNLMVDLSPSNQKLRDRSVRIIMQAAGVERKTADEALKNAGGETKAAILSLLCSCSPEEAKRLLQEERCLAKAEKLYRCKSGRPGKAG